VNNQLLKAELLTDQLQHREGPQETVLQATCSDTQVTSGSGINLMPLTHSNKSHVDTGSEESLSPSVAVDIMLEVGCARPLLWQVVGKLCNYLFRLASANHAEPLNLGGYGRVVWHHHTKVFT
jgi:hypothetical protein